MDAKCSAAMDIEEMKARFLELIKEHSQQWWSEKLRVSQGVISSSWCAGKMPRVETLLRILKLKGVSPSWMFFNLGPKYLKDLDHQNSSVNRNRETHLKVLLAENELFELRERVRHLEGLLKQQQLYMAVPLLTEGDSAEGKSAVVPILTLMRMLNDILYKSFESRVNKENVDGIIDWIKANFESNQFTTIAALKEVEKIIS